MRIFPLVPTQHFPARSVSVAAGLTLPTPHASGQTSGRRSWPGRVGWLCPLLYSDAWRRPGESDHLMSPRFRWLVGLLLLLLSSLIPPVSVRPVASAAHVPTAGGLGQLAYTDAVNEQYDIFVISADGRGRTNLTQHPAKDTTPTWSPDGQTIAFVSNRDPAAGEGIYLMNADGSNVRLWRAHATDPAWSPTGTQLAFVSMADGAAFTRIHIMNLDGTGLRAITPAAAAQPSWSPDGIRLAYMLRALLDRPDLYTVRLNGAANQLLLQGQPSEYLNAPSWSPDGGTIAINSSLNLLPTVSFVAVDTGQRQPLPGITTRLYGRGWSPNGEGMAVTFTAGDTGYAVGVMDRTGAVVHQVRAVEGGFYTDAVWNPARGSSTSARLLFVPQVWRGTQPPADGMGQPTP